MRRMNPGRLYSRASQKIKKATGIDPWRWIIEDTRKATDTVTDAGLPADQGLTDLTDWLPVFLYLLLIPWCRLKYIRMPEWEGFFYLFGRISN